MLTGVGVVGDVVEDTESLIGSSAVPLDEEPYLNWLKVINLPIHCRLSFPCAECVHRCGAGEERRGSNARDLELCKRWGVIELAN